MVFCDNCWKNVHGEQIEDRALFCDECGKLLEECFFHEIDAARNVVADDYLKQEYIKELAAKEKIAKKAFEAFVQNCSNDLSAARDELAQSAVESIAKSRKELNQKQAQEAKHLGPAQSAEEATSQMLKTKKLSSKVNSDVLEKLFDKPESRKKQAQKAKSLGPAQSAVEATSRMLKTKRLSSKVNCDVLEKLFDKPEAQENCKKVRLKFEVKAISKRRRIGTSR